MKVAVAVIFDELQRVLITRRPLQASHGGFWEFPGGKLEAGEEAEEALQREIQEEVGLTILEQHRLGEIVYDYADYKVSLIVFSVHHFKGQASCCESQMDLRWAAVDELSNYSFPEANIAIIRLIEGVSQAACL